MYGQQAGAMVRATPAFWVKVALAASFVGPLLPPWIALLLGAIVLVLPAWWFRL
jgi:hypothetical protein